MAIDPKKHEMPSQEPAVRARNFKEVALGYEMEIAVAEAQRCLNCKTKPCVSGCPVNINIPDFISHIKEGKFDEITRLTREAVQKVLGFSLAHIGINSESEASALAIAELFSKAFGFAIKNGNSSVFAGEGVEVNKAIGRGKLGHIAIKTFSLERAMAYLERIGFEIDAESVKPGVAAYLKADFGGFAVHLLQAK